MPAGMYLGIEVSNAGAARQSAVKKGAPFPPRAIKKRSIRAVKTDDGYPACRGNMHWRSVCRYDDIACFYQFKILPEGQLAADINYSVATAESFHDLVDNRDFFRKAGTDNQYIIRINQKIYEPCEVL